MCNVGRKEYLDYPREAPVRYEFAVTARREGAPGNAEVQFHKGTSVSVDPHWVRVMDNRDIVVIYPAHLVRQVTRVQVVTEVG